MRTAFAAVALLGAALSAPAAAQQEALLADGAFEMVTWPRDRPDEKFRDFCTIAGANVRCSMKKQEGSVIWSSSISGTLRGNQIVSRAHVRVSFSGACSFASDVDLSGTILLSPDGTLSNTWTGGPVTHSSFAGSCAGMPTSTPAAPPSHWAGTWRQLPSGTPAVTVAEAAPGVTPDASSKSSVRVDGNKVYVTDESGKESVVTLVPVSQEPPPTFSAPGAGELGTALQRFLAPQLWGAIPPSLPAGQRQDYVITVPQPGEGIVDAMTAAGESVVNWVTNNSAQRNLFVLGVGVSMALSHSTFAGAVDGASAPVGKQIIGGMLVMGVKGFVGSLGSTFLSNKGAIQRTHEAASAAGGEATASIPGNLLGGMAPGVMNFFRQGLSQTALTLASQGVNIATDAVVQKLGVSEKTADLLMKAPSFADGLMQPPSQPYEPGGIQLNFDR
jgi:hypothetical protein